MQGECEIRSVRSAYILEWSGARTRSERIVSGTWVGVCTACESNFPPSGPPPKRNVQLLPAREQNRPEVGVPWTFVVLFYHRRTICQLAKVAKNWKYQILRDALNASLPKTTAKKKSHKIKIRACRVVAGAVFVFSRLRQGDWLHFTDFALLPYPNNIFRALCNALYVQPQRFSFGFTRTTVNSARVYDSCLDRAQGVLAHNSPALCLSLPFLPSSQKLLSAWNVTVVTLKFNADF